MRLSSTFVIVIAFGMACSGTGDAPEPARRPDLEAAEQSDGGVACAAKAAGDFYTRATLVDYDYEPLAPEELLKRSSLVVRGRVTDIRASVPTNPLSSSDVQTLLKVEVDQAYRGTLQQGQPIYVTMARSPTVTPEELAERARSIPDVAVTLFLIASYRPPADLPEGERVLQFSSPQGFLVASSCGVAQPLDSARLFPDTVSNADQLHEAMLRLVPSDPCKSQCPLATVDDSCVEQPIESFAALEPTRVEWVETYCRTVEPDASDSFPYLVEARCDDGKRVLYRGTGFSIERRYYTPEGTFLALESGGDGGQGADCHDSAYWPERITCNDARVVRVYCGTGTFQVGDRVPL